MSRNFVAKGHASTKAPFFSSLPPLQPSWGGFSPSLNCWDGSAKRQNRAPNNSGWNQGGLLNVTEQNSKGSDPIESLSD
jgi:hypothetical protein